MDFDQQRNSLLDRFPADNESIASLELKRSWIVRNSRKEKGPLDDLCRKYSSERNIEEECQKNLENITQMGSGNAFREKIQKSCHFQSY